MNLATVRRENSVKDDLDKVFSNVLSANKQLKVLRQISKERPTATLISDRLISAQVTALWAAEEVDRLLACGEGRKAEELASSHRIVSPVTGAVVLEKDSDYTRWNLNKGMYKASEYSSLGSIKETYRGMHRWFKSSEGGLIGAAVDPRYGQSNEVGMLADYGYDTARDTSRVVTFLSFLISIPLAMALTRARRKNSFAVAQGIALVIAVPTMVHLVGTFLINNFGGLGGGL